MDKLVNEIYESVKEELFNDVKEEYYQKLETGYKKYLSNTLNRINLTDDNYEVILRNEIELNKKILKEYKGPFKLALYIYDENYEELNSLSLIGYDLALNKLKNDVTSDEKRISKNIELMDEYLKKVEPFNVLRAYQVYSEGVLDYDYASGKSDAMSFRLSHNVPKQSNDERTLK